jgi:transcription antitermination factor NusG
VQTTSSNLCLWYALRVKSNREKVVAASLEYRGLESFVPLYRARRQWSDRVKDVELPLFDGYVFCRLDPRFRLPALTIPGVLMFVEVNKTPIPIDDSEIAALKLIASSGCAAAPWPYLEAGQQMRIERGVLKDLEGFIVEVKNQWRVIVSVTLLQRSVAVEVDRDSISPIGRRTPAGSQAASRYSVQRATA